MPKRRRTAAAMAEYLVFTLAAQLASFGGLAGHERRGSDTWPGRSALIGLLGAALGTRRDDKAGQEALRSLSFAVAAYETGAPLRDYHTVQTVPQKFKRPATRASALANARASGDLNTIITLRDYRCGVLYAVAAWGNMPLGKLAEALLRPYYTLYLGRKSCPLSSPVHPRVVEAADPVAALHHAKLPDWYEVALRRAPTIRFIATDPFEGLEKLERSTEWRHDEPLERQRWHFSAREVSFLRRQGSVEAV